MITEKEINTLITASRLIRSEYDWQRIPIEVENQLNEKIRDGKYNDIHLDSFSEFSSNLGYVSENNLTTHTYMVVTFIGIWTRVAIEGGAIPDDAFDLSDALLYSLARCKTQDEVHKIFQTAASMFAKLVHFQKQKKASYQIIQIQNYISRNIFKKITTANIAKYVNLSSNYLCNLFSGETGISLHNYIQREKINVSCNLLSHTKRPISEVATYMGFQTQSNFTAIFRKWKGITPTEYRKENYREVF